MEVLRSVPAKASGTPTAVAFGNFDGVHRGHRALLRELTGRARALQATAVVITFDPHPLTILDPARAPRAIDTLEGRLWLLEELGVQRVLVLPFNRDLQGKPASWFADTVLCDQGAAKLVVAGYDCRFGRGGEGDIALLREAAARRETEVVEFSALHHRGGIVSSSRIRSLVQAGDMRGAADLLQRPFTLRGVVVHGDKLGRTIGVPTANIAAPSQVQPAAGVYAVQLHAGDQRLEGVCNVGVRPTVAAGKQWRVEVHCFDFDGDLYEQRVDVAFVQRIRDERKFAGLDALKRQIQKDCARARAILEGAAAAHQL